jgi:hypothetical protein
MNLKELDSFKISDAITFHNKLNPKLWNGTKLRPEVKQQLESIADDFLQEMGIHELDVRDITISGSNAAYSYTDHSDLDLHILVNVNDLPRSDVYKELFQAKKTIYNDTHDITIHKVPVELYVQDANEPVVSLGEYSIKNDSWIKIPTKRRSNFDQNATKAKHAKLLDIVERAIESNNLNKIQKVLKKIKQYRQAGLDKGGEFGPENLAYKALRSQGYITKLYDLRDKLHSQHLTIENMYQDPIKVRELAVAKEDTMQYAASKTPPTNPYGGLRDVQYRGGISEVVDNDFLHSKEAGVDQTVEMNGYSFRVKNSTNLAGRQHRPGIVVNVYDNKDLVGWGDFVLHQDKKNSWLESHDTEVVEEYQNKGIATMMYAVVKSLGFDIKPSKDQSASGKNMWRKWGKDADHLVSESSGYIPSEKEKNDPRFKTALTVDIKPNSIKKNASAFNSKVSRAGIPPTLNTSGRF